MQTLITSLLATIALSLTVRAQVIHVTPGSSSLSVAANNAPSGATLVLAAGTYNGAQVSNKTLTIYAPQRATVIGDISMLGGASSV